MDRFHRSIQLIQDHQSPSGAYVACPTFPTYQYCWFRDGSFIAYAMDRVGAHDSAARFHHWAARAVNARSALVGQAAEQARQGAALAPEYVLHTRYTLDGEEGLTQEWPNFQLDGFGTWLWALGQHQQLSGQELPEAWLEAAGHTARYLESLWDRPCYDCWEEHPQEIHPHTLAAIYAGLKAYGALSGQEPSGALASIRQTIEQHNLCGDHFGKFPGQEMVDASLLGLAVPYAVFDLCDPRITATVQAIEDTLRVDGGGVHRYPADTYYGGGEWVLLTAWLGWYYARAGQSERASALLDWCMRQADADGSLPEQVHAHLVNPTFLPHWEGIWGPAARPLLWSHAMVIVLAEELKGSSSALP